MTDFSDIPLIGRARLGQWFFTVSIACPCGAALLLVGRPGARVHCLSCDTVYEMRGMPTLAPNGALQVPLGTGRTVTVTPTVS